MYFILVIWLDLKLEHQTTTTIAVHVHCTVVHVHANKQMLKHGFSIPGQKVLEGGLGQTLYSLYTLAKSM